ncbi:hypothetical protein D9619_006666 [Psilocybe cf. subviscida]|uniref:Uncharacterized protein n=1 Tax=Psilocybe cf. subviscida TaxID=2480587 RepID=A0A8H5EXZ9_9AGAR|nr:hypothetical protein D9619_006666 [Psilocybe cf. subviscida]
MSSDRHKESSSPETQNDFSFDNAITELLGNTLIRSKSNESSQPRPKRQRLTKSKQDVLAGMLDMTMTPLPPANTPLRTADDSQPSASSSSPSAAFSSLSIGLFDCLRKVCRTSAQRSPDDILLNERVEQIGLCMHDAQLFELNGRCARSLPKANGSKPSWNHASHCRSACRDFATARPTRPAPPRPTASSRTGYTSSETISSTASRISPQPRVVRVWAPDGGVQ